MCPGLPNTGVKLELETGNRFFRFTLLFPIRNLNAHESRVIVFESLIFSQGGYPEGIVLMIQTGNLQPRFVSPLRLR